MLHAQQAHDENAGKEERMKNAHEYNRFKTHLVKDDFSQESVSYDRLTNSPWIAEKPQHGWRSESHETRRRATLHAIQAKQMSRSETRPEKLEQHLGLLLTRFVSKE
jgi:hypothetical protein